MPKVPVLTSKKVVGLLKKEGFVLDHSTGGHYIFYREHDKKRAVVPFHTGDLPRGTVVSILKSVGIVF